MENKQETFDRIEAYFRGELSEEDRAAFEATLAEDPVFAADVKAHRVALEASQLLAINDLRNQMQEWIKEGPPSAPEPEATPSWRLNWWWLLLIPFMGGIIALIKIVNQGNGQPTNASEPAATVDSLNTSPTPTDSLNLVPPQPNNTAPEATTPTETDNAPPPVLAEKNPTPTPSVDYTGLALASYQDPTPVNLMGIDTNEITRLDSAQQAYDRGDFGQAIQLLKSLNTQPGDETYVTLQETLGRSYLRNRDFERATTAFIELAQNAKSGTTREFAEWHLALCRVATATSSEAAIQAVRPIANTEDHNYQSAAADLLSQLIEE